MRPGVVASLTARLENGVGFTSARDNPAVGPLHTGATDNFRQNVSRFSMQINTNPVTGMVELDIDLFNPASGPIGVLLHGLEVAYNTLGRNTTDPIVVGRGLRRIGINVGHECASYE